MYDYVWFKSARARARKRVYVCGQLRERLVKMPLRKTGEKELNECKRRKRQRGPWEKRLVMVAFFFM